MFKTYAIWYQRFGQLTWNKTGHTTQARTDGEAKQKMLAMFRDVGLSSMSLIALPENRDPNNHD